jgi:2-oxoglutarate/2-oxoacid ferredoxin oxidoreductase subunit alpha
MAIELLKGNVAFAEAAIRAGCEAYFGYPITPQTEALEHMAVRMPELGRTFVQAESEIAAIHMVYGAAAAGVRTMTSSSSPGVSLMMEGLSYLAGSELPAVVVDVMRGGPGLGNIAPSQSDYFQIVKGGGHGDYKMIVLAPDSVQELIDLTVLAFDLADRYRIVSVVLADGSLGQMMEGAELPPMQAPGDRPAWALTGARGRDPNVVSSIHLDPPEEEAFNHHLAAKYAQIEANEVRYEAQGLDDARIAVVAFGTSARVAKTAIAAARAEGIAVGLLRPITLFPFPEDALRELAERVDTLLVVEMNMGQMVEDVRRIVEGRAAVRFYGRTGGVMPMPDEVLAEIRAASEAASGAASEAAGGAASGAAGGATAAPNAEEVTA